MSERPVRSRAPPFRFSAPLEEGTIISRPNRFIMLVRARGRELRCHCPTTGRLGTLVLSGLPCLYSSSTSAKRKTGYTVEAISTSHDRSRSWIGINQTAANRYLAHFFRTGSLSRMADGEVRREVRLGESRIDFRVGNAFVEVKTPLITLPSAAEAPRRSGSRFDSFDRLIRHMNELRASLAGGGRAVIVLCYLYDAPPFDPPRRDRTNSKILRAARLAEAAGVERWQVNLRIDERQVSLVRYFRSRPYA
jgi:sugar fermentation stimulation protein A